MSNAVRTIDSSTSFSHSGIIVRRGRQVVIVHVEPHVGKGVGYVVAEPITRFLSADRASDVRIYRARDLDTTAVVATALSFVSSRIPFDTEFDAASRARLYCTELVWRALQAGGVDVSPDLQRRPPNFHGLHVILISDIQNSAALTEVGHTTHRIQVQS